MKHLCCTASGSSGRSVFLWVGGWVGWVAVCVCVFAYFWVGGWEGGRVGGCIGVRRFFF
jgi:hypothetical protein